MTGGSRGGERHFRILFFRVGGLLWSCFTVGLGSSCLVQVKTSEVQSATVLASGTLQPAT